MKVKVCGIRRLEDAEAAVAAGAWALGFVFHRPSPRYVEPAVVRGITAKLPRELLKVGVFVDVPFDEVNLTLHEAGLNAAQLHGSESPDEVGRVGVATVLKAFRVKPDFNTDALAPYQGCHILLDTYRQGQEGGTGAVFDWEIAQAVSSRYPLVLAGGLNADNVVEAIRKAQPMAVDISSGVEVSPGVKDPEKIERFFQVVHTR